MGKTETYFKYKFRGTEQCVRWSRTQLEKHLSDMLVHQNGRAEEYEILEVVVTNIGQPKVGVTF